MGHRAPTVIAAMVKENLRGLGLLGSAKVGMIREQLDTELIDEIESATRVGHLSTAVDRQIFRAIALHAGLEGVRRVIDHTMRTHLEQPLFRPMLLGASHIYGMQARPALAVLCKGFGLVHRDNGVLRLIDHESALSLDLVGAEPATVADNAYMQAFAGAFQTALRMAAPKGRVSVDDIDPDRGFVRFACAL